MTGSQFFLLKMSGNNKQIGEFVPKNESLIVVLKALSNKLMSPYHTTLNVESGIKHHNPNPTPTQFSSTTSNTIDTF
jgi:hypothetical protein